MLSKGLFALAMLACVLTLPGCGSTANPNAPASVTGEVTYKGQLVRGGTITFLPTAGTATPYSSGLSPEGTYKITDMPTGEMMVTIETDSAKGMDPKFKKQYGASRGAKAMDSTPEGARAKNEGSVAHYVQIPEKYGNKNRSGLKVELAGGSNTKNFDLTD